MMIDDCISAARGNSLEANRVLGRLSLSVNLGLRAESRNPARLDQLFYIPDGTGRFLASAGVWTNTIG